MTDRMDMDMDMDLGADVAPVEEPEREKPLKPERKTRYVVDGFMVQFTALSMILLAFFIMLNALAVPDQRRERAAIGSLLGSFGILPEGVGLEDTGAYVASVDHISLRDEVILFAAFEAFLEDEKWKAEDVLVYTDESGRRRIRFGDAFLFEASSIRFHPRVYPVLDRVAAIIRALDRSVEVEGHTDLARGRISNWKLSARRASSVVRYLEEGSELPAYRLTAVGFGSTRPAFANNADVRNRRVEIVVN